MKITEPKSEKLGDKIDKLLNTLGSIGQEITKAIQEERESLEDLPCVRNGTLDFNLVEQIVKRIHKKHQKDDATILGSYLVLNDKEDLMQIQTYKRRGEKNFLSTVEEKISCVINLPPEVSAELKEKGVVKLHLKLDTDN